MSFNSILKYSALTYGACATAYMIRLSYCDVKEEFALHDKLKVDEKNYKILFNGLTRHIEQNCQKSLVFPLHIFENEIKEIKSQTHKLFKSKSSSNVSSIDSSEPTKEQNGDRV